MAEWTKKGDILLLQNIPSQQLSLGLYRPKPLSRLQSQIAENHSILGVYRRFRVFAIHCTHRQIGAEYGCRVAGGGPKERPCGRSRMQP